MKLQDLAYKLVKGWKIKTTPEYRRFVCGNCLKPISKAWHIWLDCEWGKTEVHLCRKCGKKYNLTK